MYVHTESGNVISQSAEIAGAKYIRLTGRVLIDDNARLRGDLNEGQPILTLGKYVTIGRDAVVKPPERDGVRYAMSVGNYVYFGEHSRIEAASIGSYVVVGANCTIGRFAVLKDCVVLAPGTTVPPFGVVAPLTLTDAHGKPYALPESAACVIERFCRQSLAGIDAPLPFIET